MNQLGFNYFIFMETKRLHEELINKAMQNRLVEEALKGKPTKNRRTSNILPFVGK